MDAYKAIITKRDTRAYVERPIPDDVLHRIVQAGRMAGSSKNTQPVRLIVVRDKEWMAELATCGNFTEPLGPARAAIALCAESKGTNKEDFDVGRAAQNIMVAAWNEGIASCPVSMHNQECITSKLGVPEGWRVPAMIALGYPDPAVPLSLGRKRRALDEFVRYERWG